VLFCFNAASSRIKTSHHLRWWYLTAKVANIKNRVPHEIAFVLCVFLRDTPALLVV